MKYLKIPLLGLLLYTSLLNIQAQSKKRSYTFNKGQVIDILFLTKKPKADEKIKDYFKTAIPIAEEVGYHHLPGFKIDKNTPQGNYQPHVMALGYWDDLKGRERFLMEVKTKIPNFHHIRMDIWSTFDLTYYELKEDISFEIDQEKFNVVTAYWEKESQSFHKFKQKWLKETQKAGGKIKVALENGKSPFGYHYDPDYLTVTEWESKEAFDKFLKKNLSMDHSPVKHVNQFIIQ